MHLTLAFGPEFSRHFFIHVNDLIMLLSMFIAIISSTELSEIQRKKLLLPVIELTNWSLINYCSSFCFLFKNILN